MKFVSNDEIRNLYIGIIGYKELTRKTGMSKKKQDEKLRNMKVKLRKLIKNRIEWLEIDGNRHYYDDGNDNYWELIKYIGKTPEEAEKIYLNKDHISKPILFGCTGRRYTASYSVHRLLDNTVIFQHVLRAS